jgi:hypothetical protein
MELTTTTTNTYNTNNTYVDTNYYETTNIDGTSGELYTSPETITNNYIPEVVNSVQNITTDYSHYSNSTYTPSSSNYIEPSVTTPTYTSNYQTSSVPIKISPGIEDPDTEIIPVEEIEYVPVKKKKYIKRKKVRVTKTVVVPKKVIVPVPVKKIVYVPKKQKVITKPKLHYKIKPMTIPVTVPVVPMMPRARPLARSDFAAAYRPKVYNKRI